jgi:hypothetical protein
MMRVEKGIVTQERGHYVRKGKQSGRRRRPCD